MPDAGAGPAAADRVASGSGRGRDRGLRPVLPHDDAGRALDRSRAVTTPTGSSAGSCPSTRRSRRGPQAARHRVAATASARGRRGLSGAESRAGPRRRLGPARCCRRSSISSSFTSTPAERAGSAFEVLHDLRGLSVHFMLDLDGTIYQTLDLKEARLARDDRQRPIDRHRDRQHRGLPGRDAPSPLDSWYKARGRRDRRHRDPGPARAETASATGLRSSDRPAPSRSWGRSRAQALRQYDFTDQQYDSLVQAHRDALHALSQDPLRLSPRRLRHADPLQAARRRACRAIKESSATITCRPTRSTPARRSSGTGSSPEPAGSWRGKLLVDGKIQAGRGVE